LSGNQAEVDSQQSGETAYAYGGGAYGCALNNCTLNGNGAGAYQANFGYSELYAYGGGAYSCALNNCTLISNAAGASAYTGGQQGFAHGAGGGASSCRLRNCTLVNNTAYAPYGGIGGGADYYSERFNCIAWHNYSLSDLDPAPECEDCDSPGRLSGDTWFGDPLFVDTNGWANLRLQSNSPCINAGNNSYLTNSYLANSFDLDGNPRIVGGTVDIGAYEFQSPTSLLSYAWLQQYGLPTDGSADFTDPDGDGMNNWQEWRCGTDPTNALSALRMLMPVNTGTNVMVTWQSAAGVNYFLERSTNLTAPPAFVTLATGIQGQAGTTTFVDSNARGAGPFFYRVGVGN
jgi:hypothetical protein